MKFLKNQKGLTLIELLVVIVILGIIAAIAMVMSQQEKANKNTNAQNLSILKDAVNRYYTLNNSTYPGDLATLIAPESGTANIGGPYLKEVPKLKNFNGCVLPQVLI
ncbi:MAG TPA: prepilin-type N-terminal cleavage/methylation domain-containing protein [Bacillus sp. (in: firmicutes)]|jgi:type IV pilus assembly protein PilA